MHLTQPLELDAYDGHRLITVPIVAMSEDADTGDPEPLFLYDGMFCWREGDAEHAGLTDLLDLHFGGVFYVVRIRQVGEAADYNAMKESILRYNKEAEAGNG